jgi:hypothetical protein
LPRERYSSEDASVGGHDDALGAVVGGDGVTLRELAKAREDAWLAEHGQHEYDAHDLVTDTVEELADAYNYLSALIRRHGDVPPMPLMIARSYLEDSYGFVGEYTKQASKR